MQMGFPYLTVTETEKGVHVRQDRFVETGPAEPKENETIWQVIKSATSRTCAEGTPG
jgi:aminopeptidase 2